MGAFDIFFNTIVNAATLPVAVAVDIIEAPFKAVEGEVPGTTTAKHLSRIKDGLEGK